MSNKTPPAEKQPNREDTAPPPSPDRRRDLEEDKKQIPDPDPEKRD